MRYVKTMKFDSSSPGVQGHNLYNVSIAPLKLQARHGVASEVRLKLFNMQAAAEAVKRFKAQSGRLLSLV